jgi:hypothetical protein
MNITRRSPWSGKKVTMQINVTAAQLQAWEGGMLIQDAMPDLHHAEREFIKTGLTPRDWIDIFKDDFEEVTS